MTKKTSLHAAMMGYGNAFEKMKEENASRGLTLAILCDMLLGENAADRSDDALIRRARELLTFWETHQ